MGEVVSTVVFPYSRGHCGSNSQVIGGIALSV